jgi:hypothetical protein
MCIRFPSELGLSATEDWLERAVSLVVISMPWDAAATVPVVF